VILCGPGVKHRQFGVLQRSRTTEQVEALKYKTNPLISDSRQFPFGEHRYVSTLQQIFPRSRLVQASQDVHECRFPTAARTHNGNKVPSMNAYAHTAQSMDLRFPKLIILSKVVNFDERCADASSNRIRRRSWIHRCH